LLAAHESTGMFEELSTGRTERDWDTDPDGTVRMAVVGVGRFARRLALPAIDASDYCALTTLVTGSPDARGDLAAEFGASEVVDYEAFRSGAAADAYDAVYVVTPNRLHLPNVEAAAEQGKGVLCEKPLEASLDRAERLVAACADAGVTLMTAYRMQTDPLVRRLREAIRTGELGDVVKLHGDFTSPLLSGSRGPDQWRLDPHLAGGGALYDIGVYPLNTARYLLDAEPTAVEATTTTTGPFEGVDERVAFQVRFPNDVVGSFSASFSGYAGSTLTVHGTEGTVGLSDAFTPRRSRRVVLERGPRTTFEGVGGGEVREEFDYFAHCVLAGSPPEPDGEDGLRDMRVMDAAYESAATGERVRL
jgi:xylose dehydrogenase (NAD/NADP)